MTGIIVPHDTTIVGFYGMGRTGTTNPAGSNADIFGHALFVAETADNAWGATGNFDATLRFYKGNTVGVNEKKFCKIEGMDMDAFDVHAGDIIMPAVWNTLGEATTQAITIVLRTKI